MGNLGFRPGIAINQPGNPGVAVIQYDVGVSLGGLLGAPMPAVSLWQNLSGFSLSANSTYTFSVSVDTGTLLGLVIFAGRGSETLDASLLSNFVLDDVSFSAVPEISHPQSALLCALSLGRNQAGTNRKAHKTRHVVNVQASH